MASLVTYGLFFSFQFIFLILLGSSEAIWTDDGHFNILARASQTVYFQTFEWGISIDFYFPGCNQTAFKYVALTDFPYSNPPRSYPVNDGIYEFQLHENDILIRKGNLTTKDFVGPANKITKECFAEPVEMSFYGVFYVGLTRKTSESDRLAGLTTPLHTTPSTTVDTSTLNTPNITTSPNPGGGGGGGGGASESNIAVSRVLYILMLIILVCVVLAVAYGVYWCQRRRARDYNTTTTTTTTPSGDEPRETARLDVHSMSVLESTSEMASPPEAPPDSNDLQEVDNPDDVCKQ